MGMDYRYAGSASYPRFDEEVKKVVEIFGGHETEYLKNRKKTENKRPCGHWFGYTSSDRSDNTKYVFPENTSPVLVKWFNNMYKVLPKEDVKIVYAEFLNHKDEIVHISSQLFGEIETLADKDEEWDIL